MRSRQGWLLKHIHHFTGMMLASLLFLLPKFAMAQFAYHHLPLIESSSPLGINEFPLITLRNSSPFHDYQLAADTQVKKSHSPKKATIMAIVLPGSGQIYNQKYWKAPLVYAGLGASVWAIGHFRDDMRVLNDSIAGIFGTGKTPSAQLIADRDQKRSNRDIAILCLAGVYIFQVIDATVDAHFFKFNINENIGLRVSPSPSKTLALQYKF